MDNPLEFILMGNYFQKSWGSKPGSCDLERNVCRKLLKEVIWEVSGEGNQIDDHEPFQKHIETEGFNGAREGGSTHLIIQIEGKGDLGMLGNLGHTGSRHLGDI